MTKTFPGALYNLTKERIEGGRVVIDSDDKRVVKKGGYTVRTDDEAWAIRRIYIPERHHAPAIRQSRISRGAGTHNRP